MKWTVFYEITALIATAAAAAQPVAEAEPVLANPVLPRDPLAFGDMTTAERDLLDASGAHLKRDVHKRSGMRYCGTFANGDRKNLMDQMSELKGGNANTNYRVPARSCLRVKCWNTSGVYVCNDQGVGISVSGTAIWERAHIISFECCRTPPTYRDYLSGQQFTNAQGGYNVILGYANCNHSPTQPPSDFGMTGQCPRESRMVTRQVSIGDEE